MTKNQDMKKAPTVGAVGAEEFKLPIPESTTHKPNMVVPDLTGITSLREAMLAYAEAGFYVLPVHPTKDDGKNPGSLVGRNWQLKSTRDPQLIEVWAEHYPGANIALHAGRSGITVFDVDNPDALDGILAKALLGGPFKTAYQASRTNEVGRGHYLYANPEGLRFSNKHGALGTGWGDVRANNGVIIVQPSKHYLPEGRYVWQDHTVLPMPSQIADALVSEAPVSKFDEAPSQPMRQPGHIFGTGRGMHEKIGDTGRDSNGKVRRYIQTSGLAANCVEYGYTDSEVLWVLSHHEPTMDKFGARGDLVAEVGRNIALHRPLHNHIGKTCGQAQCPNKPDWMDEEAPEMDLSQIEADVTVGESGLPEAFENAAQTGRRTPYPIKVLPPVLREYAQEVADKAEVGVDMVAPHVLGNVSVAVMGRLSAFCGYESPATLWTVVLAPPSAKKSPVAKSTAHPLGVVEVEYKDASYEKVAQYELDLEEAARANEEIRKTGKIGGGREGYAPSEEEKLNWRVKLKKLQDQPVTRPRFIMGGNATPEAMMRNAHQQQGRIAVVSAEGSQLRTIVGMKYSKSGSADFVPLIHGWDAAAYGSDRMNEDSDFQVDRPTIPVNLFAQEDLMLPIFSHPDARSGGFLPRLLLWSAEPRPDLITDDPVEQPAGEAVDAYNAFIARMVQTFRSMEEAFELDLTEEARILLGKTVGACERAAFQEDRPALDVQFLGKVGHHIPRMAALLHVARVGPGAVYEGSKIGVQDVQGATELVGAHYGHYLDILGAGSADPMLPTVRKLMKKVWTILEKAGEDVRLTKSKLTPNDRSWKAIASDNPDVLIEAMNKADELGLVTAEEPFTRSRMKFTANYEALKQFMS